MKCGKYSFVINKWMFFIVFNLIFLPISAQDLNILKAKMDTISNDDLNYEKTLQEFIVLSRKEKNNNFLFEGYLHAIRWYNDTLIRKTYCDSATLLIQNQQDVKLKVRFYQTLSYVYLVERNYSKTLQHQFKALELIDKHNEPYLYNKSLYSIGATKLFMANYREALTYFQEASSYFVTKTDLSHINGFINCVRSQAICNYYLNNLTEANDLLLHGKNKFHYLDSKDRILENAYFNLTQSMIDFKQKKYTESVKLLLTSLPIIIKNDDFANENLIYFYLGKNYWELNNKDLAITYFKKIDILFGSKQYINAHLLKAYTYLIEFYKQENNLEKQLYYTNQLLIATQNFQATQAYLSHFFHSEFDIKKMEAEKQRLENQIGKKQLILVVVSVTGILILVAFIIFYIRSLSLKRSYKKRYKEVLRQIEVRRSERVLKNEFEATQWKFESNREFWHTFAIDNLDKGVINDSKEFLSTQLIKDLFIKLERFEENKLFTKPDLTLNDLAEYCKTNRSYLSQYINQVKEKSFPDYINSLRINLLLDNLQTDLQLKHLKTEVIAVKYGYGNRKSFSNAFLKITGISYSYFIQELKTKNENYYV